MRSRRLRATAVIVAVVGFLLHMAPAAAQGDLLGGFDEPYPLRAADTSSPPLVGTSSRMLLRPSATPPVTPPVTMGACSVLKPGSGPT